MHDAAMTAKATGMTMASGCVNCAPTRTHPTPRHDPPPPTHSAAGTCDLPLEMEEARKFTREVGKKRAREGQRGRGRVISSERFLTSTWGG